MKKRIEKISVSGAIFVAVISMGIFPVHAMHISEGFLPPGWAIAWGLASLPFLAAGFFNIQHKITANPKNLVLLAMSGAFVFVMSALKIPSVTGSCSHPTGVGLGAVLFGPFAMSIISLIVLLFQALLLAHGGLTTLGANLFSMGIIGPLAAFLGYRLIRFFGMKQGLAIFLAAFIGDILTYVTTAVQLGLAHPDHGNISLSIAKFLGLFAVTQIPLAIVEGLVSVVVFNVISSHDQSLLKDLRVSS